MAKSKLQRKENTMGRNETLEKALKQAVNFQTPGLLILMGYTEEESRKMMADYEKEHKI